MMWQDIWISIGTWIFGLVLIPQVVSAWMGKPANVISAGATAAILWSFAFTFSTTSLILTAIANVWTASIWTVIALFSYFRSDWTFREGCCEMRKMWSKVARTFQ